METKKNLNTIQRKMLDEIYKEQFEKRERVIKQQREDGLADLKKKLLKKVATEKDVKKMLEAGKTFYQMKEQLASTLSEKGISVDGYLSKEPKLEMNGRYYSSSAGEMEELTAYRDETTRIEMILAEKKREMRAKIYGVAASYEEVDKDISELLKSV